MTKYIFENTQSAFESCKDLFEGICANKLTDNRIKNKSFWQHALDCCKSATCFEQLAYVRQFHKDFQNWNLPCKTQIA